MPDRLRMVGKKWMREGEGSPPPDSGLRLFGYLVATHPGKFVATNLLFILFSLPVFTIPAALCGLNRVLVKLILDGNVFLWAEFIREFKGSFRKGLLLGLIFGGGIFVAWYLLSLGVTNGETLYALIFSASGVSVLIAVTVLGGWTFVLLPMLPLGCAGILKNALALSGLAMWRSVAMCVILIGSGLFAIWLLPFSLIVTVFVQIAFTQYAVCFLTTGAVRQYIVEPWEAEEVHTKK
ncbi:MAG: DUF624 domain-containing protein [Clostridiales Family XIII bacterium]|jgi:uncharacterized membrane protein YesL|nr:DUF624 domain-containing protein [Clostridiales Family XIII bacterium]